MKELRKEELLDVVGGATISATLINAVTRAVTTIIDLGKTLGSAIRRAISGTVCKV